MIPDVLISVLWAKYVGTRMAAFNAQLPIRDRVKPQDTSGVFYERERPASPW